MNSSANALTAPQQPTSSVVGWTEKDWVMEMARRISAKDSSFIKLCKQANKDEEVIVANDDDKNDFRLPGGSQAYLYALKGIKTYMNHLQAGTAPTRDGQQSTLPTDCEQAWEQICENASAACTRDRQKERAKQEKTVNIDAIYGQSVSGDSIVRGVAHENPGAGIVSTRNPHVDEVTTIMKWGISPEGRGHHIFSMSELQWTRAAVYYVSLQQSDPTPLEVQAKAMTAAYVGLTTEQVSTSLRNDCFRTIREALYIVGSLGMDHGLHDPDHFEEAVAIIDAAFKDKYKGETLTLLKALSVATWWDQCGLSIDTVRLEKLLDGEDLVTKDDIFLTKGIVNNARTTVLTILEPIAEDQIINHIHDCEDEVARPSGREHPQCIKRDSCPGHYAEV